MAYDPTTHQLVLFGGMQLTGSSLSPLVADTWVWNGTTWTQLHPTASPPARGDASMALDPATNQLVLFGGNGTAGFLNDTWTRNGSNWTQRPLPG